MFLLPGPQRACYPDTVLCSCNRPLNVINVPAAPRTRSPTCYFPCQIRRRRRRYCCRPVTYCCILTGHLPALVKTRFFFVKETLDVRGFQDFIQRNPIHFSLIILYITPVVLSWGSKGNFLFLYNGCTNRMAIGFSIVLHRYVLLHCDYYLFIIMILYIVMVISMIYDIHESWCIQSWYYRSHSIIIQELHVILKIF